MWKKYDGCKLNRGNGVKGYFYSDEEVTEAEILSEYKNPKYKGVYIAYDNFEGIEIMIEEEHVIEMCESFVYENFYKACNDKRGY